MRGIKWRSQRGWDRGARGSINHSTIRNQQVYLWQREHQIPAGMIDDDHTKNLYTDRKYGPH